MHIIIGVLLALTGSVFAMDVNLLKSCELLILNDQKQKDEPTVALIKTKETSFIKFRKGNIENLQSFYTFLMNNLAVYDLKKKLSESDKNLMPMVKHIHIDKCIINNLSKMNSMIQILEISDSTIHTVNKDFYNGFFMVKIVNNKISKDAHYIFSQIPKNGNIIIQDNVSIPDTKDN